MIRPLPAGADAGPMCAGPAARRARASSSLRAARPVLTAALLAAAAVLGGCRLEADPAAAADSVAAPSDPVYAVAEAALDSDRPWIAEEALAEALRDSARRSADLVLLSARTAARTGKWARVDSILAAERWPDPETEGRALEMRALAALERDDDRAALVHARAALERARTSEQHGRYQALLARAHHRLGRRDSARAAYEEAAILLPRIADWLYLRAAEVTPRTDDRYAYYDLLRAEAAVERAQMVEAQTLERLGRGREAAARYDSMGVMLSALRLRAVTARGASERSAARREIVAYIAEHSGRSEARAATELLDAYFKSLPASDELVVSYSAARTGPLSRARRGFARVAAARRMDDRARYTYGTVLARMERRREAARQLALLKPPSEWAGVAALERARILLAQRHRSQAVASLRSIVRKYPGDTAAASGALMLLGDIATDDRREAAARDAYETLARRYPTSEHAPRALFQAGIAAYAAGRITSAARMFDTVVVRYAASEEAAGARYWSGRSHLRLADTAAAQEHWRWLLEHEPLSWYAAAGALRLGDGTTPWAPPEAAEEYRRYADLDSALARAELLRKVGMSHEARLELDWLARQATNDPDTERLLAVANALRAAGEKERSIELGRRAIARGHADARAYRFVYPIVEGELIATEAARRGVDPALVAAVIRQESGFNPRATSPVGARGMMQMMPRVARALARSEKITPWDPALLYRPEINVRLGVAHLKAFVAHYDHPARALAAYNAGGSRVARWSKRAGAKDPELFIERIRFEETRDYVRIVLRNRDMYRALYEW